jgi:hypothetical protein
MPGHDGQRGQPAHSANAAARPVGEANPDGRRRIFVFDLDPATGTEVTVWRRRRRAASAARRATRRATRAEKATHSPPDAVA